MPVKFVSGATQAEIQNPVRGNSLKVKKYQTLGRTAGGTVYTYEKGTTTKEIELSFEELRESEKAALQSFFDTTVDGIQNTFTYTDHRGTAWTARFLEDELIFEETDSEGNSALSFSSGSETYPGNRFSRGIYSTKIRLEVS